MERKLSTVAAIATLVVSCNAPTLNYRVRRRLHFISIAIVTFIRYTFNETSLKLRTSCTVLVAGGK